ncbi:Alpha/Beta hydrolase protein [Hypoxylon rubiginosum]|uniref:Alpha/Beta hydrolase protein n=1 Tax=Hypoxylon rubiginosum TaxID=110542 RepID=A0ACC0CPH1_9PEZI|nr:Alpha/Beta hydrolase protein [Hypoxylon rubiginosum]
MKSTRAGFMALGATVMNTTLATAQNLSYGADNFYRSNNVTLWPITIQTLYQTKVAGNLFLPNNLDRSASNSAVIVGQPMGAVKEQSANLYATKMAEQGFVTVSLDIPFWGGSEGEPRNTVSPEFYAEGFSAAVDYLGTQEFVDPARIGAIGICGSGSFVISAAKIDPRIAAIATSSMYDMGAVSRNGLRHSQNVDDRKQIIAAAAQQRWVEIHGGETEYVGGTPSEITNTSDAVAREFYDFYRTSRGLITPASSLPNLTTHPTLSSSTKFINFYPFNDIDTISPRPILFIAEPKELFWIPGAGHVDLYDRVDLIPFEKLVDFFQTSFVDN